MCVYRWQCVPVGGQSGEKAGKSSGVSDFFARSTVACRGLMIFWLI
jgi:hypothetical protein